MTYYKIDEKDPIMEEMDRLIGDEGRAGQVPSRKQYYTFGAFLYPPVYHEVCVVAESEEEAREKAKVDVGNRWWSFKRDPAEQEDIWFNDFTLEEVGGQRPKRKGGIVRGVRVD